MDENEVGGGKGNVAGEEGKRQTDRGIAIQYKNEQALKNVSFISNTFDIFEVFFVFYI